MQPIRFEVSYQLGEYKSIVSEYILSRRNKKIRQKSSSTKVASKLPWSIRLAFVVFVPLIFWYKIRKVGQCAFVIDEDGVERTSKLGVGRTPWSDVVTVHRLSQAYLVEKSKGALPLPYRCLDAGQTLALENFFQVKKLALEGQA